MKRLIIICEGPTEVEFCKSVLYRYFLSKDIYIQTPLIKKSGGGIVHWLPLKKQIENHLSEPGAFVTTLFDYYGISPNHQFPKWAEIVLLPNKETRMDSLEQFMREDIDKNFHHRFIPYVQLHEFEGLLFNL